MTIDEARHIAKITKSYTLRRDMLKFIKRKEREKWQTSKTSSQTRRELPKNAEKMRVRLA